MRSPEDGVVKSSRNSNSKSCSDMARAMLRAKVITEIKKNSPAKLPDVNPLDASVQDASQGKVNRTIAKSLHVQTSGTAGLPTPPSSGRGDGLANAADGNSQNVEQHVENIIQDPQVYLSAIKQYVTQIFPQLPINDVTNDEAVQQLIITCEDHVNFPGIGPVHPTRMVLSVDGTYSFQCLYMPIDKGSLFDRAAVTASISKLASSSGHVLCPGVINYEELSQTLQIANLNISNLVRLWGFPFSRIDSVNCSLWHLPRPIANDKVESSFQNVCYYCKSTFLGLLCLTKGVRGHDGSSTTTESEEIHISSETNRQTHKHSIPTMEWPKRKKMRPPDDTS